MVQITKGEVKLRNPVILNYNEWLCTVMSHGTFWGNATT